MQKYPREQASIPEHMRRLHEAGNPFAQHMAHVVPELAHGHDEQLAHETSTRNWRRAARYQAEALRAAHERWARCLRLHWGFQVNLARLAKQESKLPPTYYEARHDPELQRAAQNAWVNYLREYDHARPFTLAAERTLAARRRERAHGRPALPRYSSPRLPRPARAADRQYGQDYAMGATEEEELRHLADMPRQAAATTWMWKWKDPRAQPPPPPPRAS